MLNGRYWVVTVKRKSTYLIHRVIWTLLHGPIPAGYDVDHEDTNKQNNNANNLRLATDSQNKHNVGLTTRNSSGVKGISWCKQTSMWKAQIMLSGKSYSKRDPDLETLKVWLNNQRAILHGNFANEG